MKKAQCFIFQTLMLMLLLSGLSQAQEVSPAEEARKQLLLEEQRLDRLRKQQDTSQDILLERPKEATDLGITEIPSNESPCFLIEKVALKGDSVEKFQWLLTRMGGEKKEQVLNRCLGAVGINLIMRRMQNAVIDKGFHHHPDFSGTSRFNHWIADADNYSGKGFDSQILQG